MISLNDFNGYIKQESLNLDNSIFRSPNFSLGEMMAKINLGLLMQDVKHKLSNILEFKAKRIKTYASVLNYSVGWADERKPNGSMVELLGFLSSAQPTHTC